MSISFYDLIIFHCMEIHPLMDIWVNCFHHLAMGNSATMSICVRMFVWAPVFNSLRYSSAVESLDHMLLLFLIFEELKKSFPQWLYHFTFLPVTYEDSSLCTSSTLGAFHFLTNSHPVDVEYYHIVVLIHVFFMTNDAEIAFLCFLAICMSFSPSFDSNSSKKL